MPTNALLVIDIQQAAFDGAFCPPIDRATELVASARTLIDAAELQSLGAVLDSTERLATGLRGDTP